MAVYFNDLDHVVYFTLCYSDYFNFPLTKKEIYDRLPKVWDWLFLTGQKLKTNKLKIIWAKEDIEKSLLNLERAQKIEKKQNNDDVYYCLKNCQQVVIQRLEKQKIAKQRQTAIYEASNWLEKFPTIKAVALTGASAVNNAELNDDLDFCVVVKKNTLWISRFFVILLAKILSKQPQIDAQAKRNNKQAWCFNLWLDEDKLNIVNRGINIYQVFELKQMRWLVDKANIKEKILLANLQLGELINIQPKKILIYKINNNVFNYYLWPINYFFYFIQAIYRFFLFGKENYSTSLYQAHFNDLTRQTHIFQKIKRKMKINDFSDF